MLSVSKVSKFWLPVVFLICCESRPPFGACGLTYGKCLKSGGCARSPKADSPCASTSPSAAAEGHPVAAEAVSAAAPRTTSRRVSRVIGSPGKGSRPFDPAIMSALRSKRNSRQSPSPAGGGQRGEGAHSREARAGVGARHLGSANAAGSTSVLPPPSLELSAAERDEPRGPELLERAIDVHGGDSDGVGKLVLGHWEGAAAVMHEADPAHPRHHLADEVGDARVGVAPSDVEDPLLEDGRVRQRLAPEGIGQAREAGAEIDESLVLDECHLARGDAADGV